MGKIVRKESCLGSQLELRQQRSGAWPRRIDIGTVPTAPGSWVFVDSTGRFPRMAGSRFKEGDRDE